MSNTQPTPPANAGEGLTIRIDAETGNAVVSAAEGTKVVAFFQYESDAQAYIEMSAVKRDAREELIRLLRIALADAIRRPLGVVPDSASGLISQAELNDAEKRHALIASRENT